MTENKKDIFLKIYLPLILTALICGLVLVLTDMFTRENIERNREQYTLRYLHEIFPPVFNNNIYQDRIEVHDPLLSTSDEAVTIYRARLDNTPAGVIIAPVTTTGYNGEIAIAIGIRYDGRVTGIYTINHHETEGLGGQIAGEDSDWPEIFTGNSLDGIPPESWRLSGEGGEFDQISGATITSRAMVNAVKKTLEFYNINKDNLFR